MKRIAISLIIILGVLAMLYNAVQAKKLEKATFAGGCFWCMEPPFETLQGVTEVVSGYMGGTKENPTYEEVSSGRTGYREVIQVTYDPSKITYKELLNVFWRQIDPTDTGGQFADKGTQYRTAIFYHNAEQKRLAEESRRELEKSGNEFIFLLTLLTQPVLFYRLPKQWPLITVSLQPKKAAF